MGEGDGDVGEDDGGVGEDRGDDDGPRRRSSATGSKGERATPSSYSSLTSSLYVRRVSPLVLGSHGVGGAKAPPRLDLSLCLSLFLRSRIYLSPFFIFPEIRNSDWIETLNTIFLWILAFLQRKKGKNHLMGCPRGSGARPPPGAPPCLVGPSNIVSC